MIKATLRHLNKNRVRKLSNSRFYLSVSDADIDYKNLDLLSKFISPYGAIKAKSVQKLKQHRRIVRAIKRARYLGLIPFSK